VVRTLFLTVGGGISIGLICATAAIAVAGRTSDHLVESTLTTVVAYGSFLIAEHFQFSGVLATVAAGLLTGNLAVFAADDRSRFSSHGREFILGLWEFIAFVANSLIFLLIGVTVARVPFGQFGATSLLIAISLVLIGRALTVYPLCLLFSWSRQAISIQTQHVLWWGGLRGALGLALALSLPPDLAMRGEILIATFGVVVFSVIIQGLTMPPLLRLTGFMPKQGH
jgi:CPA1 family monovalent cation:H+ antiporter